MVCDGARVSGELPGQVPADVDAVVVGAGAAGLAMLHRLRGLGLTALAFEAGDSVGGTWYWNGYPGARCDTPSLSYSFAFSEALQQEWCWTERFAAQPEILRYLNHVADRFDLRRDIRFGTRVTAAAFGEGAGRWRVETDRGDRVSARFLIMATGCLSVPYTPEFDGLDDFRGARYHTGNWPREAVDVAGLRVGVIGTGSSAIQVVPVVARRAAHVDVFQRNPAYSVPARNGPLDPACVRSVKANYAERRRQERESRTGYQVERNDVSALAVTPAARRAEYERRWQRGGPGFGAAFSDLLTSLEANETATEFFRAKIREIVRDPAVAERLSPRGYPFGTRRLCVDTGYYETFNRDNVTLVDVGAAPIERITPTGVRTADADYPLDVLIFATGFDAITGALLRVDLRGRGGAALRDVWADGPRTYLGLMVAGFPNLYTITGPGSPSVLSNVLVSIEQHVDWIAGALAHMVARGLTTMEASAEVQAAWSAHVAEVAAATLYPLGNSPNLGVNIPGKPRVFMPYAGGVGAYRRICDEVAAAGYRGFVLA